MIPGVLSMAELTVIGRHQWRPCLLRIEFTRAATPLRDPHR